MFNFKQRFYLCKPETVCCKSTTLMHECIVQFLPWFCISRLTGTSVVLFGFILTWVWFAWGSRERSLRGGGREEEEGYETFCKIREQHLYKLIDTGIGLLALSAAFSSYIFLLLRILESLLSLKCVMWVHTKNKIVSFLFWVHTIIIIYWIN